MPNAIEGKGIWAACGVNEANVAMTATETIANNPRVLGADPLVEYLPAEDGREEQAGGIGEEDIVCLVLPYIHSAREGVERLGSQEECRMIPMLSCRISLALISLTLTMLIQRKRTSCVPQTCVNLWSSIT